MLVEKILDRPSVENPLYAGRLDRDCDRAIRQCFANRPQKIERASDMFDCMARYNDVRRVAQPHGGRRVEDIRE
jgi:hypothetical protein